LGFFCAAGVLVPASLRFLPAGGVTLQTLPVRDLPGNGAFGDSVPLWLGLRSVTRTGSGPGYEK
jgi:hypothetical protein